MNFTTSVRTCFRKYATFTGVASRSEYWWFFLFYFVIEVTLFLTGQVTLRGLVSLVLFLPSLGVGVRRMHDTGRSGWWILTSIIAPWGIYLLCLPSKTENNMYAAGYMSEAGVVTSSAHCTNCGKMRLPGQSYCAGCGEKFPDR